MKPEKERILLFDENDWAFGYYVERSFTYVENFETSMIDNINDVIELYNVHEILSNKRIKTEIREQYADAINNYVPIVAGYFKAIDNNNFIEICSDVCVPFREGFWGLFERFESYKNVNKEIFYGFITNSYYPMYHILRHKKLVKYYDSVISDCLRNSDETGEILIRVYMEKNNGEKLFLPKSLDKLEYENLLRKYINTPHPSIGKLRLIEMYQSTDGCPISDKLRLEARKKVKEIISSGVVSVVQTYTKVGASFRNIDVPYLVENNDGGTLYIYDKRIAEADVDFYTIIGAFIRYFGYMDNEYRSVFPVVNSQMGITERFLGVRGVKEYHIGQAFMFYNVKASADLEAYVDELAKNGIEFESAIKWFFEVFIVDNYDIYGMSFSSSSKGSNFLEKCRNLASEMDGILKQYSMLVENGEIDRELFEMSSRNVDIDMIPSMRKDKYAYLSSSEIITEANLLFSDQCMLSYIEKYGDRYLNLYDLLMKQKVLLSDYKSQSDISQIKWLATRGALNIENDIISINEHRAYILKDFYDREVVSKDYYDENLLSELNKMYQDGDIRYASTLFSEPEADYLNYMLNKKKFSNGLDLRNRYIHSTNSKDDSINKKDYFELLKVLMLILLKINEEFFMK